MKKIAAVLLAALILTSFASCAKADVEGTGTTAGADEVTITDEQVKIVLPVDVLEEKYQHDLDAYCKDYGYISAKLDSGRGEVTVVLNKFSYDLMMTQIGMKVIAAIYDVAEGKDYPCVKAVKELDKDGFRSCTIAVDREKYEKEGDTGAFVIAQSCFLYQLYDQTKDYSCEVTIVDAQTGDVIEVKNYDGNE